MSSNSHVKINFLPIMEAEINIPQKCIVIGIYVCIYIHTDINVYPFPDELKSWNFQVPPMHKSTEEKSEIFFYTPPTPIF